MKAKKLTIWSGLTALVLSACVHKPFSTQPATTANDCTGPVPSFKNDIQPILNASCAKNGCHDGINVSRDYSIYKNILHSLNDSVFYYSVIVYRSMPQDAILDDSSYHLIKCWLNNGYPDN